MARPLLDTGLPLPLLTMLLAVTLLGSVQTARAGGLQLEQLLALREVNEVAISPDGTHIAYVLRVPRDLDHGEDGSAWAELHVVPFGDGESRPYVHGAVNVSKIRFTPDGRAVTYLAKRGEDTHASLWAVPIGGGESHRLLGADTAIKDYRLSPDGSRVAYLAASAVPKRHSARKDRGFDQEVFEEDGQPIEARIATLPGWPSPVADPASGDEDPAAPLVLELDGSAVSLTWDVDEALVVSVAPRPLIDDRYMFQHLHVFDTSDGSPRADVDTPGKLGPYTLSPDGRHLAAISAADPNDPKEGRLLVASLDAPDRLRDLFPGLEGHIAHHAWRDADTLVYVADLGVETEVGTIGLDGTRTPWFASDGSTGSAPVVTGIALSASGHLALRGDSPSHPREVYAFAPGGAPVRRSHSNPWLANVTLAKQTVYTHEARDGLSLSGILVHPLDTDGPAPLLLMVHGGPESHVRNGWVNTYGRPAQIAAADGYAVFFPNYRGSTGRGVAFSKISQGDAGGGEFDDLLDAVAALAEDGIADRERVGVTGGSYGGYATAWCSTRFTEHFRAGVMFVGISNKHDKAFTTDIPIEDQMVHTLYPPWTRTAYSLERSPISFVEQSQTPLLIAGGTADTRVHPSQSLQLYRALKMLDKTVRYVRYPGEKHGNARSATREDFARRLLRWMNWFVKQDHDGLPPWELDHVTGDAKPEASDDAR